MLLASLIVLKLSLVVLVCSSPLQRSELPQVIDAIAQSGDLFEGDILLTAEQRQAIFGKSRNAIANAQNSWMNKRVPYVISSDVSERLHSEILRAFRTIEGYSCVHFEQRNAQDNDYVEIKSQNTGCWSMIGRTGGRQEVNIQANGCSTQKTIVHELLHALGFYHMQSATDRDNYVKVHYENIEAGNEHNFDKYGPDSLTSFGLEYDIKSIMHYTAYAFSKNGRPTIVPFDEFEMNRIGNYQMMSASDITKLNILYRC